MALNTSCLTLKVRIADLGIMMSRFGNPPVWHSYGSGSILLIRESSAIMLLCLVYLYEDEYVTPTQPSFWSLSNPIF